MAKAAKYKYPKIEKAKSAKKETRTSRAIKKSSIHGTTTAKRKIKLVGKVKSSSRKSPVIKKTTQPIIGRMKGTIHYEADLTQPIEEKWDADFERI